MKPLTINHKIYGNFKITEPVLIELIRSKSLQRLKKIDNRGAWILHHTFPGSLSRYRHSLGTVLLLRRFGASLNEQVAGLLHDVSHTAFSHVADYVFNSHIKQDYQDNKLAQAFKIQGVGKILKKYKISPKLILDEKNFPLLEKNLPHLCADRLDYTFQEPFWPKVTKENPKKILKYLTVHKNNWAFTNQIWAKKFGWLYLKLNQVTWCMPLQAALYEVLSQAIKSALAENIITKKDLFGDDESLILKLKRSKSPEIISQIKSLKNLKIKIVNENRADFYTRSKARIVDPYFLKNGRLIKLSTVDKNYKKQTNTWLKKAKKGFWIKIINY